MKRILTIIFAVMALVACNKKEEIKFNASILPQTKWEGELKLYDADKLKSSSTVTLRFDTASNGKLFQKRSGAGKKDEYDFSYSAKGQVITFDCPVINGSWSVSDYNTSTMRLTLEPSKTGVMILSIK
jgi:hypothetical protein